MDEVLLPQGCRAFTYKRLRVRGQFYSLEFAKETVLSHDNNLALKIKFFLQWAIDHYKADPGGQAIFYGGHKRTILIWSVCFSKGLSTLAI